MSSAVTTSLATALAVADTDGETTIGPVVCVDLDGTLCAGDVFWESLLVLAKQRPVLLPLIAFWLLRGKARAKREVARRTMLDVQHLPYRPDVIAFIDEARAEGRTVMLATAADESQAKEVATHLGRFNDVLASNGVENLNGQQKAHRLAQRFGCGRFEYVGNDWMDVPAWHAAGAATVVAPGRRLLKHLRAHFESVRVLVPERRLLRPLLKAVRPVQWIKNLLLFVPLVTSHRLLEVERLGPTLITFLAFCLCASAIYVLNDLFDIQSDRLHPRKRFRPFASGELSVPIGLAVSAGLFAVAMTVAVVAVSSSVGLVLLAYAVTSAAYSVHLKREPVADVFVLAGLYVLRIFAGGIAADIVLSSWLLAFAMFFFLNLALVKRFSEVNVSSETLAGRGYAADDSRWMQAVGTGAGYMAVVVLAIYTTAPEIAGLYARPSVLMLLCPLLLYWVTRTWLRAARTLIHDDPVFEAVRDPVSYVVLVFAVSILLAAR